MTKQTFDVFLIKPTSGIHLAHGRRDKHESGLEILHSDTLKSALFVAARQLFGEQIEQSFLEAFRLSSGFPFCELQDGFREYFFPKPLVPFSFKKGEVPDEKQVKVGNKVSWIGKKHLEELLQNGQLEQVSTNDLLQSKKVLSGDLSRVFEKKTEVQTETKLHLKDLFRFSRNEIQQRVMVPRGGGDTETYYLDRRFFFNNEPMNWKGGPKITTGLFVLAELQNKQYATHLQAAFELLSEEGIGTDRSVGNGIFEIEKTQFEIEVPQQADSSINFSLFCPSKNEIQKAFSGDNSQYNITKRGGWIAGAAQAQHRTLRKNSIHMITEGSVFSCPRSELLGQVVDLRPEAMQPGHPVWRDGTSLFLPLASKI